MNRQNFDITIIGGSFAGMTAALALAGVDENLKIAVVEKQNIREQDKKRDGRAYAISSTSLSLFKEIGIYDEVSKYAGRISDIKITDHKSPFILDFIGLEVDRKDGQLGQIIESFYIHNALRNRVLTQKNITLFCPNFYQEIEFNENEARVKLDDGAILNSKLLLACDGRFSRLRELYQIPTMQKSYQQTAIVFNISHERPHENVAWEKFLPGGPLAILPFQNQHESSIVWITPDQEAEAILSLDEENFLQQLMKKMEGCLGKVKINEPSSSRNSKPSFERATSSLNREEITSEKFSYPLTLIEAKKFCHEKMLLIGDAACGVHPIAGQGFNLAIAGIKILRELVAANLYAGLSINSQTLIESYSKRAGTSAKKMLIATDVLNSLFETKSLSISLMRDLGLGVVNKIPTLKKFFIKMAGGLK